MILSPSATCSLPGLHRRLVGGGSRRERSSEDAARVLVAQVQVRPDPGRRVGFGVRGRADRARPPDQRLGLPPVYHRAYGWYQRLPQLVDVERLQTLYERGHAVADPGRLTGDAGPSQCALVT